MKKILLLLVTVFLNLPMFSQANNAAYNLNTRRIDIEQNRAAFGLTEDEFNNVEGSPYANENFISGNIYKEDKLILKEVLLRYNIYSDEIEVQKSSNSSDGSYQALIKDPDMLVKIGNDIYIFVPFEGSVENGSYFSIIEEESNFDLYKKAKVNYSAPFYARTSYERDRSASFRPANSYYLVDKNGGFYKLPSSKSKIVKVMGKKEKEVKSYIKKNRLDIKNEKDLIKLVKYYNSLL